jgi:biotin carboxyl carrier protein
MRTYTLTIGGRTYEVEVRSIKDGVASVVVNGTSYSVEFDAAGAGPAALPALPVTGPAQSAPSPAPLAPATPSVAAGAPAPGAAGNVIVAPMPGLILDVLVKPGDAVKAGQTLVRIEAMKMENEIKSPIDGVVAEVRTEKGREVQDREVLVVLST